MTVQNVRSAVGVFLLSSVWSYGCMMLPSGYEGRISQKVQEAVIIHDNNKEELILGINYNIKGKDMPKEFAWIITLPNEPDKYSLADKKIFKDMSKLSEKILKPKTKTRLFSDSVSKSITEGVELGKRVKIGKYDIQPVRGVGKNALEGLNKWLKSNGFPTEDEKHMKYLIKNGFTFLCVKIIPEANAKDVPSGGLLSPLHLSFKTKNIYYPLLFSSRQGVFDVNLHILTRDQFSYTANVDTLFKMNWGNTDLRRNILIEEKVMPQTLKDIFHNIPWVDDIGKWNYSNFRGFDVNGNEPTISKWSKDIFFKTVPFVY